MKKHELHKLVVAAITTIAAANNVSAQAQAEIVTVLDEYLAPRVAGGVIDLAEVTKVDKAGKFTEIKCAASGVWLPATLEYFYEDKSEKPRIVDTNGVGLKRSSRQAEAIGKTFIKTHRASIQAITDDVLALDATPENAKEINHLKTLLRAEKAKKVNYKNVGLLVKPEAKPEPEPEAKPESANKV